jgi:hypothetical protein
LKRECWEETGYHFVPSGDTPICMMEWNYLSPRDKSYQHSLMLVFQGTVEDGADGVMLSRSSTTRHTSLSSECCFQMP